MPRRRSLPCWLADVRGSLPRQRKRRSSWPGQRRAKRPRAALRKASRGCSSAAADALRTPDSRNMVTIMPLTFRPAIQSLRRWQAPPAAQMRATGFLRRNRWHPRLSQEPAPHPLTPFAWLPSVPGRPGSTSLPSWAVPFWLWWWQSSLWCWREIAVMHTSIPATAWGSNSKSHKGVLGNCCTNWARTAPTPQTRILPSTLLQQRSHTAEQQRRHSVAAHTALQMPLSSTLGLKAQCSHHLKSVVGAWSKHWLTTALSHS